MILGSTSSAIKSSVDHSNLSCRRDSNNWRVSIHHPNTIINSFGVPSNSNLGIEKVSFLDTGSSSVSGLINICIDNRTEAILFLMISKCARHTLIKSSRKELPRPNDVVETLTITGFTKPKGLTNLRTLYLALWVG